jgi:hypothetical protein
MDSGTPDRRFRGKDDGSAGKTMKTVIPAIAVIPAEAGIHSQP